MENKLFSQGVEDAEGYTANANILGVQLCCRDHQGLSGRVLELGVKWNEWEMLKIVLVAMGGKYQCMAVANGGEWWLGGVGIAELASSGFVSIVILPFTLFT